MEDTNLVQWQSGPCQLKTKRLKEYTIHSHCSIPPNNTYVNFERFARVMEDISVIDSGLEEVAQKRESLQEDVEALLSIYNEKETWYKEESSSVGQGLSRLRYEFRKAEARRKDLQEDIKATEASLDVINSRYLERQAQLSRLSEELNTELRWLQELMSSLNGEGENGGRCSTPDLNNQVNEALKEMLSRTCGEESHCSSQTDNTESFF